jgi:hypothetical protein
MWSRSTRQRRAALRRKFGAFSGVQRTIWSQWRTVSVPRRFGMDTAWIQKALNLAYERLKAGA